jgi:LmbE family N-acetylglucosaminyl deacetylase
MIQLRMENQSPGPLQVLCIGAHSDDIEIGCGATILQLAEQYPGCVFHWVVLSAVDTREAEARTAATLFGGKGLQQILLKSFADGFMPFAGSEIKNVFEQLKNMCTPDLIFTHNRHDAHQDHRLLGELTWNTFRNHLILEYEIPKYDGDLGQPTVFVHLGAEICKRKVQHIVDTFESQQSKRWFEPETFFSLMRLRGMECNAPSGYAEAFYCRKLVL